MPSRPEPRSVAVIGSGYVGTVVAACLAHIGHLVTGVESDPYKLGRLQSARAPFLEPDLDELLLAGVTAGRLRFTADLGEAMGRSDLVFICVGTPPGERGQPDMTAMATVARDVARHLGRRHILINKSTVPVGSGRWLASMVEEASGERAASGRISVVSNPEFLREGRAVADYLHPDRVVVGGDEPAAVDELVELYRPILDQSFEGCPPETPPVPLVRTDLVTAEVSKYASNAFLATKVSFANEMARLCEMVGADVDDVTTVMGLDARIGGQFLDAGIGWGGSCFGKDVAALIATADDYGWAPRILPAAAQVNADQRRLAVDYLRHALKTLGGARVAVLGLAFKPGTDDLRDSPALDVARRLADHGALLSAFDPVVRSVPGFPDLRLATDAYAAARGVDAVVLATDWPSFGELDFHRLRSVMRGDVFFDGRNVVDPSVAAAAGLRYQGVGRSSRVAGREPSGAGLG